MARHGLPAFIYVADSALITNDNLALMTEGVDFIARLPENFGACGRLISAAVASCSWQDVGRLTHRNVKGKEVPKSTT